MEILQSVLAEQKVSDIFNNRYSTHMYIEIHVHREIVMHTAAA